jgi:hypothetical protein
MTARDYRADMNALLDIKVPDSEFVPAIVAAELTDWLRDNDPDLLRGWLDSMAVVLLTDVIGMRARSSRARAQRAAAPGAFAKAAAKFESSGDAEHLSVFRTTCVVSEDNLRRAIGDMTNADHLFVADRYELSARSAQMDAAFHRAVAKRLTGGKRTSDVMDEETYLRLRESITRTT